jgi:hypothetical protein
MTLLNDEECHVEGKSRRNGDDWGVQADQGGMNGGGRGSRAWRLGVHHLRAEIPSCGNRVRSFWQFDIRSNKLNKTPL